MKSIVEEMKTYKPKKEKLAEQVFPNRTRLLKRMQKLDLMSERDAYELINKEYDVLIQDIFGDNAKEFQFLLSSPKFLNIMIQILNQKDLTYLEMLHFNSFIYDYIVYDSVENPDEYIMKLIYMLGEVINKSIVRMLIGCGLDENFAIFIAVSAASSFKPELNIKRLNFTLTTALPEIMSEDMLMSIYECFFSNITDLFINTIFDTDIKDNVDTIDWINDQILTVDNRIMFTVLCILESMTPIEITKVLMATAEAFKWKNYDDSTTKISLKKIDKEIFNKISIITEQLEGDGYILP